MTAKFVKCTVNVSRLRVEEFDPNTGKPIIVDKTDWNRAPYKETKEVTYTRGEEVVLPYNVMEKLGKSVSVVMAPVTVEPVEVIPVPTDGGFKDINDGPTVADMIPKEESKPVKKSPGRPAKK